MRESELFSRIKAHLPGRVCRVENSVNSGFPDVVCFCDGGKSVYLELKVMPDKYPMILRHLTGVQWELARSCRRWGHKYWFLLGVGSVLHVIDPLRLDGYPAGFLDKEELEHNTKATFPISGMGKRREEFLETIC